MQTIKIVLKPSGSVADFSQDFNIYQGSFNGCIINVAVPASVLPTNIQNAGDISTVAVNIATTGITRSGKEFQTEKHNLVWKKDFAKDGVSYKLYGSTDNDNLDDFTQYSGSHTLVINVMNIIQGDGLATPVSVITSQECTLNILPSAYLSNEKPVELSEIDKTNANVNYLLGMASQLPLGKNIVNQYNIADMPIGHTFTLNGYNEPLCAFYSTTYTVPIKPNTTATKSGISVFSNVVSPDAIEPGVIGYQNEYFLSDSGVVVCRTNRFNISQGSIGNYTLLENGSWQIVNQEYITTIKNQSDVNSNDITILKRLVNTGTQYIGQYPTQEVMPTDAELNAFVFAKINRAQQAGDEVSFVKLMAETTDIIYNIKYSEVTATWTSTPQPSIEAAGNENLGLVTGTNNEAAIAGLAIENTNRKIVADIASGEILDIKHLNENSTLESLSTQTNRNSTNIAINTTNITANATAITNEITRAVEADNANLIAIAEEKTRAEAAEQINATAISAEKTRAETAELELETNKLNKTSINENYMQGVSFSLNGDTSVATATVKNPVSGENQEIEVSVLDAASSTNTGLMTSEMVQSLSKVVSDVESLKYLGRQLQSFSTYADAEAFDWSTMAQININDYFIVEIDESRTEPTEHNKTTKYACVNAILPITTTASFIFQMVVTTVVIQVATETSLGGVLSVNTNGYVYVESNGAMKLVGYDNILTSITNLTTAITAETARAKATEQINAKELETEKTRAETAEAELAASKAEKTELPTKTSELTNDSNFVITSELPTKTSELANDSNFATISQIPTKTSQISNDSGFALNMYDVVIRTQTEFEKLYNSPTWLDAKSVAFVGDGGTLKFDFSDKSNLIIPESVIQIDGFNRAILCSNDVKRGSVLKYSGTLYNYLVISNLTVYCDCMNATDNVYIFDNFYYLTNCNSMMNGSPNAKLTTHFLFCKELKNCKCCTTVFGVIDTYHDGFANCHNLNLCSGKIFNYQESITSSPCVINNTIFVTDIEPLPLADLVQAGVSIVKL